MVCSVVNYHKLNKYVDAHTADVDDVCVEVEGVVAKRIQSLICRRLTYKCTYTNHCGHSGQCSARDTDIVLPEWTECGTCNIEINCGYSIFRSQHHFTIDINVHR